MKYSKYKIASDINNYTLINCVDLIKEKNLKLFFTWWNRQTFGTFLKTLIFGKFVGKDDLGNKYYKSKSDERWVVYSSNIDASKITSDWYLWMHHTIDKIPSKNEKKYKWQKKHWKIRLALKMHTSQLK